MGKHYRSRAYPHAPICLTTAHSPDAEDVVRLTPHPPNPHGIAACYGDSDVLGEEAAIKPIHKGQTPSKTSPIQNSPRRRESKEAGTKWVRAVPPLLSQNPP